MPPNFQTQARSLQGDPQSDRYSLESLRDDVLLKGARGFRDPESNALFVIDSIDYPVASRVHNGEVIPRGGQRRQDILNSLEIQVKEFHNVHIDMESQGFAVEDHEDPDRVHKLSGVSELNDLRTGTHIVHQGRTETVFIPHNQGGF